MHRQLLPNESLIVTVGDKMVRQLAPERTTHANHSHSILADADTGLLSVAHRDNRRNGHKQNRAGLGYQEGTRLLTIIFFVFAFFVVALAIADRFRTPGNTFDAPSGVDQTRDYTVPADGLLYIGCGNSNPPGNDTPNGR